MANDNIEAQIWAYLKQHTQLPEIAIAGIMGNIQAESDFDPANLENAATARLKMSDAEYTSKVNNGTYTRAQFIADAAGYGLCQWTYGARKAGLYDYCKSKGTSIANWQAQLEYMLTEGEYKAIEHKLKNALTINDAAAIFCKDFERPAETVLNSVRRGNYGQAICAKYHGSQIQTEDPEPVSGMDTEKIKEIIDRLVSDLLDLKEAI